VEATAAANAVTAKKKKDNEKQIFMLFRYF
jgi:hypothetical protein